MHIRADPFKYVAPGEKWVLPILEEIDARATPGLEPAA